MSYINGFIVICFSILFVFIVGLYNFVFDHEENGCTMTYMFEYPQFVRISLSESANKFKAYGLYAYGEGRHTEKVRDMKFTGIPVLFIHGHRGSYKQVRSLASVSLRKAVNSRSSFHFDYFTVDLNEEYSGFFGGVLPAQTEFVKICIERIISLYKKGNDVSSQNSVILIGHSMGGLVAKGVLAGSDEDGWRRVRLIVSLATPHRPAVLLDAASALYYDKVDSVWDSPPPHRDQLTLISIGGGSRDLVVHSTLTSTPHADISLISSRIAGVWLSVDHLCILWCKELVFVLVRALFDSVVLPGSGSHQLSHDPSFVRSVFSYHLLERSGGSRYSRSTSFNKGGEVVLWKGEGDPGTWLRLKKEQLTWSKLDRVSVPTNIMVSLALSTASASDTLLIHTVNHKTHDWIFACKADTLLNSVKICSTGESLSHLARISPTKDFKRKTAILDLVQLKMKGKTHIVVRTLPSDEHVSIWFDVFRRTSRTVKAVGGYMKSVDVVSGSQPGHVFHSVQLPELYRAWAHHQLVFTPRTNCSPLYNALAFVTIPWANEGALTVLGEGQNKVQVKTFSNKPQKKDTKPVEVELILNPECSFDIRLEKSIVGALGAIVSRCYISLITSIAVCLLMVLSYQLKTLGEEANCPIIHSVMTHAVKPYYILPSANIIAAIARYLSSIFPLLAVSDVHQHSGFMETLFIPLLLHCSAAAITYIMAASLIVAVVFHGQAFNNIVLRFLNKLLLGLPWLSEYVMSGVGKLPVLVSGTMVFISCSACSGLAIYVGLVYYFVKIYVQYSAHKSSVPTSMRILRSHCGNNHPCSHLSANIQNGITDSVSHLEVRSAIHFLSAKGLKEKNLSKLVTLQCNSHMEHEKQKKLQSLTLTRSG